MPNNKLYKKKAVNLSVYHLALERFRLCFRRFDRVVVSFSGGKDSTVCLNLALQVARELGRFPLEAIFFDEEAVPPETIEYVDRVRQIRAIRLQWLCIPIQHRNACSRRSPWWYPWAPEDRAKW